MEERERRTMEERESKQQQNIELSTFEFFPFHCCSCCCRGSAVTVAPLPFEDIYVVYL